jgi:hypothetical protein
MGRSILKQPDKQFIAFLTAFCTYVDDHEMEWFIEDRRVKQLHALANAAIKAYNTNLDPYQSNHFTATDKKHAFAELKNFLGIFIDSLEGNPDVSDKELDDMKLRPRKQPAHQPLPIPAEVPLMETIQQHHEITVYVTRMELGQPAHGEQLRPFHGFKLRWKFEDETHWHFEISTRLHHTIYFEAADEAHRVTLAVAWINPRLQEGPWTINQTLVIG